MPTLSRRQFTTALIVPRLRSPQIGATPAVAATLRLAGAPLGVASLDPALARDLDAIFLMRQLHRGLLTLSPDLEAIPALAELESSDRQAFAFHLRQEARFANGRPVLSDDVHRSLVRAMSSFNMTYLGDIAGAEDVLAGSTQTLAGFEAIDDHRFTIRLTTPSQTFPVRLAAVQASVVDTEDLANGTGPFVLDALDDEVLSLAPNPNFPSPARHAVSMRIGAAAANAQNLLQAGDIDLATVDGDTAALLADPASGLDLDILRTPQLATFYIALSNTMPPWSDLVVRQAVQATFDPNLATRRLSGDTVDPAAGLVPPVLLKAPAWSPASRDHEVPASAPLPVYAADIEPVVQFAAGAADAGIAVQPIQLAWEAFLDGLAQRRFPAYAIYWGADYPLPDAFLRMLFHSGSADNYVAFADELFDRLVESGDFTAAQQRLVELAVVIPVYHDVHYTAVRRGILGTPVSPMGLLGLESVEITS